MSTSLILMFLTENSSVNSGD